MASIGVPGVILLLGVFGLDPASALVAHAFAAGNIGMMMMIGGGL